MRISTPGQSFFAAATRMASVCVLPVPGPPVRMEIGDRNTERMAPRCSWLNVNDPWAQVMASSMSASGAHVRFTPSKSSTSRPAIDFSASKWPRR